MTIDLEKNNVKSKKNINKITKIYEEKESFKNII